jgi:chemotaxis protein methyltransferase CheR
MKSRRKVTGQEHVLIEQIASRAGLRVPPAREREIAAALGTLLETHRISGINQLAQRLETDEHLLEAITDELVVGETCFFRHPEQFDAIRTVILPSLLRMRSDEAPIRIWSAGCSTGEEPYSLAILMEEERLSARAEILATDISRSALEKARRAVYGSWSLREYPENVSRRYFHQHNGQWHLIDPIRCRVTFTLLNLASRQYPSTANGTAAVDLILCRNVLIYFDPEAVRQTAARLFEAVSEGGWLVAGPSDPPLWDYAPFETVVTPGGVFYKRPAGGAKASSASRPKHRSPSRSAFRVAAERRSKRSDPVPGCGRVIQLAGRLASSEADNQRIHSLVEAGRLAEARRIIGEALRRHPLEYQLHYLSGVVFLASGRLEEAAAALRRSTYLQRSFAAGYFALGLSLEGTDRAAALRAFVRARDLCGARPPDEAVTFTDETASSLARKARAYIRRLAADHAGEQR